jgi:ABC-type phosphate transport system substrate-binding protein
MGNFDWDKTKWPNSTQMIKDFAATGVQTVLINDPYVTTKSFNYALADSLKYFAKNANTNRTGQITMWNDPQILKENLIGTRTPKIPATKIRVVYRIDGSGTSEVFTSYLNAVAPTIWTKPGNKNFANAFPGDISKGVYMNSASGSQGVAMIQGSTNGSIGYNEISYARGLKTISVENEAGRFMQPTISAASVFLGDFVPDKSGAVKINYKNPNKLSYNISTFTYGIAYKEKNSKNDSVKKFFNFMLDTCGKKAEDLGYSPIRGAMLKFSKARVLEISSKP